MIYHPNKWIVVRLTVRASGDVHYRVFATWSGGYTQGDSWKLNSGITTASLEDSVYSFSGTSGSVYKCHEHSYGTTVYGSGVLNSIIEQSKDTIDIEILPEDADFLNLDYSHNLETREE